MDAHRLGVVVAALSTALEVGACEPASSFERDAVPVLEARCASARCHGARPGEITPAEGFFVAVDAEGRLRDPAAARRASLERVTTLGPARTSSLLRVPRSRDEGGGPHAGGVAFVGPDDTAAAALVRWIEAEPRGAGGEDVELDDRERLFGETVLPVLVERCGRGGCHGPTDVASTAFPAHRDPESGGFAPVEIARAYQAVRKHIDGWSDDPSRSRLVRKAIGVSEGGLVHRAGAATLFPEAPIGDPLAAPGIQAILAWARAERRAAGVLDGGIPTGIVFVRSALHRAEPYRLEPSSGERVPSDLFFSAWPVARGGEAAENLTEALHAGGPAEVRDPAVSHDATRVAFSMRRRDEPFFSVWELDLAARDARRISSPDVIGHLAQCTYAPTGVLVCAWDGHERGAADGGGRAPDLVALDRTTGLVEPLTFTPAPEVHPCFLASGKARGSVLFATRRIGARGREAVLFRFPLDHDPVHHAEPEYHAHFGASLAPRAPVMGRDLPDGRQVMILLESADAADDRGALALLDRSLGPYVEPDRIDHLSLGGYQSPVTWLDRDPRWRDPVPLPDGRIVASRDSPERPGDDALVVVSLHAGLDGYAIDRVEWLIDAPGFSDRSAAIVHPRPPEDDPHEPVLDRRSAVGYLVLRDVAVLESLFGRAEPVGPRPRRTDIAGIRVATWNGAPEQLADVPVERDGSAYLAVPARTPLRLSLLDRGGREVGRALDRWYYAEGAERVPGGTNAATYPHACAGCHGALDGDPRGAVAPEPDAISAASVTLATHEDRDRRRPRAPRAIGATP